MGRIAVALEWRWQKLYKLVLLPLFSGQCCDQYGNDNTETKIIAALI